MASNESASAITMADLQWPVVSAETGHPPAISQEKLKKNRLEADFRGTLAELVARTQQQPVSHLWCKQTAVMTDMSNTLAEGLDLPPAVLQQWYGVDLCGFSMLSLYVASPAT